MKAISHLAGHPVGTQLAEAQRWGDFPEQGHHVHMLDETLQYKRSLCKDDIIIHRWLN
jgi:hypothetical protein